MMKPPSRKILRRAAPPAAIAAAAMLAATPAMAADWDFSGFLSESLTARNNPNNNNNDELAFTATTRLSLALSSSTPDSRFSTSTAFSTTHAAGSGTNKQDTRIFDPNASASFNQRMDRWSFGLSGGFNVTSTSVLDVVPVFVTVEDSGLPDDVIEDIGLEDDDLILTDITFENEDVTIISANASASANYSISPTTNGSIGGSYRARRFRGGGDRFADSDAISMRASLGNRVHSRLRTNVSVNSSLRQADNAANTRNWNSSVTGGFNYSINNSLGMSASAGPRVTYKTSDNDPGGSVNVGVNARASMSWRATNATSVNFAATQNVVATNDGDQNNAATLSFGLRHAFNNTVNGGVRFSYGVQTDSDDVSVFNSNQERFNASPSINVSLAPAWRASAGYTFTLRRQNSGDEISNRVFINLSTRF